MGVLCGVGMVMRWVWVSVEMCKEMCELGVGYKLPPTLDVIYLEVM